MMSNTIMQLKAIQLKVLQTSMCGSVVSAAYHDEDRHTKFYLLS